MKKNDLGEIENLISQHIHEDFAVLEKVVIPGATKNVHVYLKREDKIHHAISGNKWRKLKYNLINANEKGIKTLLTFGGAYSNHIYACASAGKIFGFNTIGIIRGEKTLPLNSTLEFAQKQGMHLEYIDRTTYRQKHNPEFIKSLENKFGEFYLIPEGGSNQLAIKGCVEILDEVEIDFDYIISACGTGGTLSGLICGLEGNKKVIGIPVLKSANFLNKDIENFVLEFSHKNFDNWELKLDFHFGGYAKVDKTLIDFMIEFENINQIRIEPIYTAKMLFAIKTLIESGEIQEHSTVIALHTGGLQGRLGMESVIKKNLS